MITVSYGLPVTGSVDSSPESIENDSSSSNNAKRQKRSVGETSSNDSTEDLKNGSEKSFKAEGLEDSDEDCDKPRRTTTTFPKMKI